MASRTSSSECANLALLSNPVFNHNDQIRRWEEKIEQAKSRLLEMKQSVNQKETVLQKLVETILSKEKCYSNYANGGIYYDVDNFRGVIGIFMEGYASYITPYYDDEKISKQVMSEAIRIQVEWEKKVINNFNTKQI